MLATFRQKHWWREPITAVTANNYLLAIHLDMAGIDVCLVGDSAAMVVHDHDTTLPISLHDMLLHCRAVAHGWRRQPPLLVGDLPFGSYEFSSTQTNDMTITLKVKAFPFLGRRVSVKFTSCRVIRMSTTTLSFSLSTPRFVPVELETSSPSQATRFKLVSYNILAQVYVKSSYFPHSPSPCLRWKARSHALLALLSNLGPHFLCLQEVDEYESFYKGNMEKYGYSSIYIQRSGQKRDGCGIFFRQQSAELILQENIEYNDLVNSIEGGGGTLLCGDTQNDEQASKFKERGDPNDPRVRLKRDCVGIMAAFKLKDSYNHIIIVANTHLYWDPEWVDVKLEQAKHLLLRLAEFKRLVADRFKGTSISLIVAGDFNSTPGDKVYQYLCSGSTSSSLGTVVGLEGSEDIPICLRSVYDFTKGEPKFTNCTPDFTDTLDYIFFTPSDCIKPVSLLEVPGPDSSHILGGLPNFSHPSDHLPIGAEFEINSTAV